MPRPVKWAVDLYQIRERALTSRTEAWSRSEIEHLFSVGRATAQTLMKAIGQVQTVGSAHFTDKAALTSFLDAMIAAPNAEVEFRTRLAKAEPAPKRKALRVSLPGDLRHVMLPELPANIMLSAGRLEITAQTAVGMLESLLTLALVMQNDLDRFRLVIEPASQTTVEDDNLRRAIDHMRSKGLADS